MEFTPAIFPFTKRMVAYNKKKAEEEKKQKLHTGDDGLPRRRVTLPSGGFYYVFEGLSQLTKELLEVACKKMNRKDDHA